MTKRIRSIPLVFDAVRFGNDVLAHRLEAGLTGEQVARIADMEKSVIFKYERGEEDNMKMQNFLKLCNVWDLDARDYFVLYR